MSPRSPILGASILAVVVACGAEALPDGTVVTYAGPPGVSPSTQYSVQIAAAAGSVDSFVYSVPNQWPSTGVGYIDNAGAELDTSWTSFAYSGQVRVTVSNLSGSFAGARVLPTHAGIVPSVSGNEVTFTLSPGAEQLAVDFCEVGSPCTDENDPVPLHPLLIFADPLEAGAPDPRASSVAVVTPGTHTSPGTDIPRLGGAKSVLYFGPGVYDLGLAPYPVASNQTVYLAGGAYLMGAFLGQDAQDVHIFGRGILSGERFHRDPGVPGSLSTSVQNGTPPLLYMDGTETARVVVDGITFIQSPFYNIEIAGSGNSANDVKVIAWYDSTDGIQVAYDNLVGGSLVPGGGTITNSFFKVGDDAIKLFSTNLSVSRCTIWKLLTAAAFELGANESFDVSHVTVEDSDVIRTEHQWPSRTNAVFAANYGGSGHLHDYRFDDIRVENASWQLFQIVVTPNAWLRGPTALGSIGDLRFSHLAVTDAQKLPDLFQGYSLEHPISDVTFEDVVVDGQARPNRPAVELNANRVQSLSATFVSDPLWQENGRPAMLTAGVMNGSTTVAGYSATPLLEPDLPGGGLPQIRAVGDFFGDGAASILGEDPKTGTLAVWRDPLGSVGSGPSPRYEVVGALPSGGGSVAGVGDFNGDGYTDVLTWNAATQAAHVLLMKGASVTGTVSAHPTTASDWRLVGVGDFDQNGDSDLLLRDSGGSLEILYFGLGDSPVSSDFAASSLGYSAATPATFDETWNVVGVGDVEGDGYASIVWENPGTREVGYTYFTLSRPQKEWGTLIAPLPAGFEVEKVADFNGDGAADLWLSNPTSRESLIWFLSSSSSGPRGPYAPSPPIQSPGSAWGLVQAP